MCVAAASDNPSFERPATYRIDLKLMSESALSSVVESPVANEWPADFESYELLGIVGRGAFAEVRKARTNDGRECAVKVLNLDHVDTNLEEIRREVQAMRLSLHPNILPCYTAFVHDTNLWLVTQLMRKGSSLHCLQSARRILRAQRWKQHFEEHILYILHETLLGLQYIHSNGQIHRDVKAGNILLDGNGDVRIADFGVSGWLVQAGSQQTKAQTFVGTPCWMAPEVMEQVDGYDYKADIWSLGITALELAKGYAPYARYQPMKVLILTIQNDPPTLDTYDVEADDDLDIVEEIYSKSFSNFVATCLSKNPTKRPNCQELLRSKYLSHITDPGCRDRHRQAIQKDVCDLVKDVGAKDDAPSQQMPGNSPVSILLSQDTKDRPAGTTWVFMDGSQVLSSSAKDVEVDDVMQQLDEFGMETGGEHYDRTVKTKKAITKDEDDLDQFMDEFELNTAGEDFQRPSGGS